MWSLSEVKWFELDWIGRVVFIFVSLLIFNGIESEFNTLLLLMVLLLLLLLLLLVLVLVFVAITVVDFHIALAIVALLLL